MFCGRGLEFVLHKHVDQVGLDFFVLDVVVGVVIFKFDDDVVTHLGFRGELQQVAHNVGHFTLIDKALVVCIDDAEGLLDLQLVKLFLTKTFLWTLRRRQHFYQLYIIKTAWKTDNLRIQKNSLFNLDENAGHVVSATAVAVWGVNVLANDLVEHVFDDLGALLGSLSCLDALGQQINTLL